MMVRREQDATRTRRPAVTLGFATLGAATALLVAACGEDIRNAPPTAESLEEQEGVGIWRAAADSAPLDAVRGVPADTPIGLVRSGGLFWSVDGIEELRRGIAGAWPDVEDRWVAVRVRLAYDTSSWDTGSRPPLQEVRLRQNLVLVDERGGRHRPNRVHDRLDPPLDQPVLVPETGMIVPIVFALGRGQAPLALEVHDPLGSGILEFGDVAGPGAWQSVRSAGTVVDEAGRGLWEVLLARTRREAGSGRAALNVGETAVAAGDAFDVVLQVRNVSSTPSAAPDPSTARLYLGSGRTVTSVSLAETRVIAPGQATMLNIRFLGVPRREALTLVLEFAGRTLAVDAAPGLLPERVTPVGVPVLKHGIRCALYAARRTADGGWALLIGLTSNRPDPMTTEALTVTGRGTDGVAAVPALMRDQPARLYPGYEERRWIELSSRPAFLELQLPRASPIRIPLP